MGPSTVAGTSVVAATDDARRTTILVSDLHVPEGGGPVADRFLALLAGVDDPGNSRLVVLGDLFDAYIGRKQNGVGVWREVLAGFAAAADRGLAVTVLHGNRDFMLDAAFAAAGRCRVVAGGLRLRLGERDALLLHGDELCQRDVPYQRAKRVLRHPLTRALLRNAPLRLALHLARRARERSGKVIASGDQTRFDPTAAALQDVVASGVDTLVFGHIHRPARGRFGALEYVVLPAFDETGVCLEARDGDLFFRTAAGDRLPDYPSREFV